MKAWIGKYNAHKGQKTQTDQLQIEFLQTDWRRVSEILGQKDAPHWSQIELELSVDPTGVTIRSPGNGETGLHFTHKQPPHRADGTRRQARMGISRTATRLSGMNRLPEFSMGEVMAELDFDRKHIFVPLVSVGERKPVRKQVRDDRSKTAPTAATRAAHGERGPDGERGSAVRGRLESATVMAANLPQRVGRWVGSEQVDADIFNNVANFKGDPTPVVTPEGILEKLKATQTQLDELILGADADHGILVSVEQHDPGGPVKFSFQF